MPLTNFGAILNFAETIEREDLDFYTRMAEAVDDASVRDIFRSLAKEGKKNITLVQRTRRENVTEMILEPIRDFERGQYQLSTDADSGMNGEALREAAASREERAHRYYTDAATKIRALPEVSRALKTLAKQRGRRIDRMRRRR